MWGLESMLSWLDKNCSMDFTKSPLQPCRTSSKTDFLWNGNILSSISRLDKRPGRKAFGGRREWGYVDGTEGFTRAGSISSPESGVDVSGRELVGSGAVFTTFVAGSMIMIKFKIIILTIIIIIHSNNN